MAKKLYLASLMKQLLAISFSAFLVLTLSGWTMYVHECAGIIKSVSFFDQQSEEDACHLEEDTVCCSSDTSEKEESSCHVEMEEDGCCEDIEISKSFDVLFVSVLVDLHTDAVSPAFLIIDELRVNSKPINTTIFAQAYTRPPPAVPLFIQFQSLIFYA